MPAAGAVARVTLDGTEFQLANNIDALYAAIEVEGRGVLRFRSLTYGNVLAELVQRLETRYGPMSRQYRDSVPSPLLCAGCLWEFPGSYKMSLQAPEMFADRSVIGATPGFDQFGRSGVCPQCGSNEGLLVYECFLPEQISEADIEAIRRYWRELAQAWRKSQQRSQGICNDCNDDIAQGQGYLFGTDLICENCVRKGLLTEGLESLRNNPHYYGSALLRKARPFRR